MCRKLITGSKKLNEELIKKAENPRRNSSASFGRKLRPVLLISDALVNEEITEEQNRINKNDPRNKKMRTPGGYTWEEYGFHII